MAVLKLLRMDSVKGTVEDDIGLTLSMIVLSVLSVLSIAV